MAKTPTKPAGKAGGRRRNAARQHAECSAKRTILKQRIRNLTTQLDSLQGELLLVKMHTDILHSTLATVVETMGLEGVLDPFGEGLTPEALEANKSSDHRPTG